LLLVLDTCEHVIGAVATLAEAVLRAGGTLRLLATSREPLRAEGEWVYPVPPLAVPTGNAENADELLRYGGVRLFERLRAAEPHAADRRRAAIIAAICRRLDGIPLAIELAAARASCGAWRCSPASSAWKQPARLLRAPRSRRRKLWTASPIWSRSRSSL
jgi:predicted ATPase